MNRDWIATARTPSARRCPTCSAIDDAIVVIKFGGHAMGDDEAMDDFRPRRGADAAGRREPGDRAWRRTDDQRDAGQAGDQVELRARQAGDRRRPRWRWSRWCCPAASTSASCRRSTAQGGRAVGLSGKDADLMVCEPADPALGCSARPVEMIHASCATLSATTSIPVIAPLGAGPRRARPTTSTATPPPAPSPAR